MHSHDLRSMEGTSLRDLVTSENLRQSAFGTAVEHLNLSGTVQAT